MNTFQDQKILFDFEANFITLKTFPKMIGRTKVLKQLCHHLPHVAVIHKPISFNKDSTVFLSPIFNQKVTSIPLSPQI